MALRANSKRASRGFFWRQMRAGDPSGKPLAEWAYTTPRYPAGLTVSDLRTADQSVQWETALVWFLANLKPFELGPGPWLAFTGEAFSSAPFSMGALGTSALGTAGLDEGHWAPTPLAATDALREQFYEALPDSLIEDLGRALGHEWMWIDAEEPAGPSRDVSAQADIEADLAAVEEIIRGLLPEHGGIGHNFPDGEPTITHGEQTEALQAISRIRAGLAHEPLHADEVRAGTQVLTGFWQKLGPYALKQADTFITEANKAVAQKVPHLVVLSLFGWHRIGHLLEKLWALLN